MSALLTIELPCLRSSILNGNTAWELNLVATYHRALHTLELVVAEKGDLSAYSNERLHFYEALLGACDSSWLFWSWRLLYAQNARYRHMYIPLAKFELELNPQHRTIVDAVLARDVDKAIALSIDNYDQITKFIEQRMMEAELTPTATHPPARPKSKRGGSSPVTTGADSHVKGKSHAAQEKPAASGRVRVKPRSRPTPARAAQPKVT